MITLAAAAYPLNRFDSFDGYEDKISAWVGEAAGQGAQLLVFPEYGAMELAALGDPGQVESALRCVSGHVPRVNAVYDRLARAHGVTILGASAPVFDAARSDARPGGLDGRPVNRAALFGPDGPLGHQDKQIMTMFERDPMDVRSGGGLQLFDTPVGRVGVLICYDSEFPLLGRKLVEAGAEILLVPSCTDSLAGYWRVRIGAMARALEGQCVVVQSPTVGAAEWCPVVDENHGAAGVYGPPDLGFPQTGVLAEGALDAPGWVLAEVPRAAVARVRRAGHVRNLAHWPEQERPEQDSWSEQDCQRIEQR